MTTSGSSIPKVASGIRGLDDVTGGGLPAGRATLVCGGPGCGKTVLAMGFLVRGAREYDQPGLFVSFEETRANLLENFAAMGFELERLIDDGRLGISHIALEPEDLRETGEFTLDALMVRVQQAADALGAERLVLDSMDAMFGVVANEGRLRRELARMLASLRERGLTTIVTGEMGSDSRTRHGFEQYVSDCVLFLDHRVTEQVSKRRLRVVKYRGSSHGADEYPFLIGPEGLSVIPITTARLDYEVTEDFTRSGIPDLDEMLGGNGLRRGSSVLVSGKAGTGKSSIAAAFARAVVDDGERALYFSFEESPAQIVRNMRSIGLDLESAVRDGTLVIEAHRSTLHGLEEHLLSIMQQVEAVRPTRVVLDPITNFITVGARWEVRSMLTRLLDQLKEAGVTVLLTALTPGARQEDETSIAISSLMDTWITVSQVRTEQTHRRELYVVKSRGMAHAHVPRELILSSTGLSLRANAASEVR